MGLFSSSGNDTKERLAALDKSHLLLDFKPDGTVISANQAFYDATGFTQVEIVGEQHGNFADPLFATSKDYTTFWEKLAAGEAQSGDYRWVGADDKEIWVHAFFNPLVHSGKVYKIVAFAIDISAQKKQSLDYAGQIDAIGKSQAVIQFDMNGNVIDANGNFLRTMGYDLHEIRGKSHRMFVDKAYGQSPEYAAFWDALKQGKYQSGEYKRAGAGNRTVWIQASYNPIIGSNGKPLKIVEYATDITAQVKARAENERMVTMIKEKMGDISMSMQLASDQSSNASMASSTTSDNVQSVAAGAEELNASVGEISQSMERSRNAVDTAFNNTQKANQATQRLAQAAASMTKVVELIQEIASQINLLSLNATIESARAGEAGKGFAVVAQEVKNLASQASEATEQISHEIEGMQTVSGEVVTTLQAISSSIEAVREYVTGTASAVEQQSAVAREMSSNMQNASNAVAQISMALSDIVESTQAANENTQEVQNALQSLT